MSKGLTVFGLAVVTGIVLLGCPPAGDSGAGRPPLVPAEGTATYKGSPVANAVIVFSPTSGTFAASAQADSNGRFVMRAFPDTDGVVAGEYKVSVAGYEAVAAETAPKPRAEGDEHDETSSSGPSSKLVTPEKYADVNTSGLTVTIPPEGKKDITFALED